MSLTFVGRERETAQLQDALEAATTGHGRLILIGGEAGAGKSTLLARLSVEARERGIAVLSGAADRTPSPSPYDLWIDLFHSYSIESTLPELPEWAGFDSAMPRIDTRATLFHEIHQLFADASRATPILMILEDLHRADPAGLELLQYLGSRLNNHPMLVVGSYRTDELTERVPLYHQLPELVRAAVVERIQLGQLDATDVRSLVASRYDLSPDDEERLVGYVQEHAEGNPLFIMEILRMLEAEGSIEHRTSAWALNALDRVPVPPLVRQMVDGRMKRLPEGLREPISVAALLGRTIPFDTWLQVSGADDGRLEQVVDVALEQSILVQRDDGSLAFAHALIREVLQAGIILPRRRKLHRQIADALIAEPVHRREPEQIAYHLLSARDERAAAWLVEAGLRAVDLNAYEVAEEHLGRALDLMDADEHRLRVQALRSRATARMMIGMFDGALADQRTVLSLARSGNDPRGVWQALIDLGDLWASRDYDEVGAYYRQALDLARDAGDSEMIAHSLNRMGNWYTNIDRPPEGLRYHEEALRLFQERGDAAAIARTLDLQGIAAYMAGDMPSSAASYRQAVRLFREQNDPSGLAMSLPTLMMTGGSYDSETVAIAYGSDEEWFRFGEEGLEIAREIGWRAAEAYILTHFAIALGIRGRYQSALDYAQQGLDLARAIDHREWITSGHFALGAILVDCLNTEEALHHLRLAYDSAMATHSLFWSRMSAAALAWAHLTDGAAEPASQALQRAGCDDAELSSISQRQCAFRAAELALSQANPAEAFEIRERLTATLPDDTQRTPVPHLEWLRGRALADLGSYDDAESAFDSARNRARELGYLPVLWRVELSAGRMYEQSGRRQDAAAAFQRGREIVLQLAGEIDRTPIQTRFREAALSLFPRAGHGQPAGQNVFGLSDRECQVLSLVARGLTDGEVGEQLYISSRTVGRHLQSIYNKLGVNSRTAAARLAMEQRLI